eukprot:12429712-Karenia_brevis.AAC.1
MGVKPGGINGFLIDFDAHGPGLLPLPFTEWSPENGIGCLPTNCGLVGNGPPVFSKNRSPQGRI